MPYGKENAMETAVGRSPSPRRLPKARESRAGPAGWSKWLVVACVAALMVCVSANMARATSIGQLTIVYEKTDPWGLVNLQVDTDLGTSGFETDVWWGAGVFRVWLDPKVVSGHPPGDPLGPGSPVGPDAAAIAASATWTYSSGMSGYQLSTFCSDLLQDVPVGSTVYDVSLIEDAPVGAGNTPMGVVKDDDLRELFGPNILEDELGAPVPFLSPAQAEAFQACVWEIIYEDRALGYDLSTGNVQVGSVALVTEANGWLSDILTQDLEMEEGLRALVHEDSQDFVLAVPGIGRNPLPEPMTMLGMFLGIAASAGYVRRRTRSQQRS